MLCSTTESRLLLRATHLTLHCIHLVHAVIWFIGDAESPFVKLYICAFQFAVSFLLHMLDCMLCVFSATQDFHSADCFGEPPLLLQTVCKIFHRAQRGLESLCRDMHTYWPIFESYSYAPRYTLTQTHTFLGLFFQCDDCNVHKNLASDRGSLPFLSEAGWTHITGPITTKGKCIIPNIETDTVTLHLACHTRNPPYFFCSYWRSGFNISWISPTFASGARSRNCLTKRMPS